jgi:hypothetical protein
MTDAGLDGETGEIDSWDDIYYENSPPVSESPVTGGYVTGVQGTGMAPRMVSASDGSFACSSLRTELRSVLSFGKKDIRDLFNVDSGAEIHICHDVSRMRNLRVISPVKISVANGSNDSFECERVGDVALRCGIILHGAYYMPRWPMNYISVRALQGEGYEVSFPPPNRVRIARGGKVYVNAERKPNSAKFLISAIDMVNSVKDRANLNRSSISKADKSVEMSKYANYANYANYAQSVGTVEN